MLACVSSRQSHQSGAVAADAASATPHYALDVARSTRPAHLRRQSKLQTGYRSCLMNSIADRQSQSSAHFPRPRPRWSSNGVIEAVTCVDVGHMSDGAVCRGVHPCYTEHCLCAMPIVVQLVHSVVHRASFHGQEV